jgi:threonine/homoserine/homoserine lactone efflux protein
MIGQQTWLRIIGGGVLVIIGINAFKAKIHLNVNEKEEKTKLNFLADFSSIFILTVSNPMTILYFAGVYTGIGLSGVEGGWMRAVVFSIGVTFGSMIWWMALTGLVDQLRTKFNEKILINFSRLSGLLILIFGISIIISAL